MNHGCVTLDEVFAAASARAASLVPETSGYLALAIGDASSRLPLSLDERTVLLTTEGTVTLSKRGEVVSPRLAARAMRDLLARLLAVSSGTMPGLAGAARPRDESERGVDAVIDEIEAALIPVNRAAARRALARLSRETLRAREAGKLRARPAKAAPAKAPEQVAAPMAPPRERTPIPPPELLPTPSSPGAPVFAARAPDPAPVEHEMAPLLAGLTESVAPPAVPRPPVEALPRVVITEPVIAAAAAPVVEAPAPTAPIIEAPAPIVIAPIVETPAPVLAAPIVETPAPLLAAPIVETPAPLLAAPIVEAPLAPIVAAPTIVVLSATEPVIAQPVELALAAPEPPALFADLAEPTPTVLGMAIEIDDAPTPIDAMLAVSLAPLDAEEPAPLEAEAPLAPRMPVTSVAPHAEEPALAPHAEEPALQVAPTEALVEAPSAIEPPRPAVEAPIVAAPAPAVIVAAPEPIAAEVLTPIAAEVIAAEVLTPIAAEVLAAPLPAPAAPLPAPVAPAPVSKAPRPILSGPRLPQSSGAPTRADDLLASFAFTSGEETMMTATAVSLKKLALDPTPAPPVARAATSSTTLFSGLPGMDRHLPSTSPPPVEAQSPLTTIPTPKIPSRVRAAPPPAPIPAPAPTEQDEMRKALDDETPITRMPAVQPRKGRPGISVAAAILAGTLAGLFAVARLRPDLVTSLEERIGPALSGSPRAAAPPEPPAPAAAQPPAPVVAR
jgi:hypothetical protein